LDDALLQRCRIARKRVGVGSESAVCWWLGQRGRCLNCTLECGVDAACRFRLLGLCAICMVFVLKR